MIFTKLSTCELDRLFRLSLTIACMARVLCQVFLAWTILLFVFAFAFVAMNVPFISLKSKYLDYHL